MKKWIFPLVLIIVDLIFAILFMTPSIVKVLPQFLLWIRDLTQIILTAVSNLLRLPIFVEDGTVNNIIANTISFFIITFLIILIYFIIYFIVAKTRKSPKTVEKDEISLPKSEFDPILFEKRVPIFRLVFMWVPLNLWILYFFLLNSYDLQEGFKENAPNLYSIFEQNISFYNHNARPLFEKDDAVKFAILIIGLVSVAFLYWMIFSMFAILLKKPIAKGKAKRALRDHERRVNAIQGEETFVETSDILEHARFVHSKSIVETIATIDIKQINEENKNKQNYFDDLAHGIVDLGVEEKHQLHEVAKPITEKKPLRVILSSLDKTQVLNENIQLSNTEVTHQKEITSSNDTKKLTFDDKFDVLNQNDKLETSSAVEENNSDLANEPMEGIKESSNEKVVKPLMPTNLRKPVKVSPVKPKNIPLKDLVDEKSVIDLESSDKNDK